MRMREKVSNLFVYIHLAPLARACQWKHERYFKTLTRLERDGKNKGLICVIFFRSLQRHLTQNEKLYQTNLDSFMPIEQFCYYFY